MLTASHQDNPRIVALMVAAKSNDIELENVTIAADSSDPFNKSTDYSKISPLGKIPAFEDANGFALSEAIAIAIYSTYQNFYF